MRSALLSGLALLSLTAAGVMLEGCDSPRVAGVAIGHVTEASWVSVKESSYAAADVLAKGAGTDLDHDTPLVVGTLSDVDQVENSTALGRMIAEQVGARFVQLGYNVTEVRLRKDVNVRQSAHDRKEGGEFVLSRNPDALKGETPVGAMISGTYALADHSVLVNLRLVDAASGKVLAAHDYTLVLTPDIAALAEHSANEGNYTYFGSGWVDY